MIAISWGFAFAENTEQPKEQTPEPIVENEYPRFNEKKIDLTNVLLVRLTKFCLDETNKNDPFCKAPLDTGTQIPEMGGDLDKAGSVSIGSIGGASWEDAIIQGTAAFIAKRAEEELLANFVDHLKNELCGKDNVKKYFPNTCTLTNNVNTYTRQVPWGLIKSTIEKDLNALPYRLVQFEIVPALNEKNVPKDVGEYFYSLIDIIFLLERGEDPFDSLAGLGEYYREKATGWQSTPASSSLYCVGIVTEILRPLFDKKNKELVEEEITWKIAARLIYKRMEDDQKDGLITVDEDILMVQAQQLESVYREFSNLADEVKKAKEALSTMDKSQTNDQLRAFRVYIESATRVVQSFATITKILGKDLTNDFQKVKQVTNALGNLGDAMDHVRSKEYNLVFVDVLALVENVQDLQVSKDHQILPGWYYQYGPFLVEMATAKDAESVEKALENAAAPVGTWRGKRGCGAHTFSLTSYFGAGGGGEWVKSFSDSNATPFYGLFMPVGVEYAIGIGDHCSIQFMGSVANLGTIADFRYHPDDEDTFEVDGEDAEVEEDPTYTFAQVFSPGVYGSVGISKTPLVVGGGVSLAPRLRTIKYDAEGDFETAEEDEINVVRAHIFIAVDVTLFRLGGCDCRKK